MTPTMTESPQIAAVVNVIRKAAKVPLTRRDLPRHHGWSRIWRSTLSTWSD